MASENLKPTEIIDLIRDLASGFVVLEQYVTLDGETAGFENDKTLRSMLHTFLENFKIKDALIDTMFSPVMEFEKKKEHIKLYIEDIEKHCESLLDTGEKLVDDATKLLLDTLKEGNCTPNFLHFVEVSVKQHETVLPEAYKNSIRCGNILQRMYFLDAVYTLFDLAKKSEYLLKGIFFEDTPEARVKSLKTMLVQGLNDLYERANLSIKNQKPDDELITAFSVLLMFAEYIAGIFYAWTQRDEDGKKMQNLVPTSLFFMSLKFSADPTNIKHYKLTNPLSAFSMQTIGLHLVQIMGIANIEGTLDLTDDAVWNTPIKALIDKNRDIFKYGFNPKQNNI